MTIKVLGSGCSNCKKVYQMVEKALQELNIKAELIYVTDFFEIANAGILRTPGLIINQNIVSSGRVPSFEDIKSFIEKAI